MENNIEAISVQISNDLKELCSRTLQLSSLEEFPNGVQDIEAALNDMNHEIFDVVVCGEVKKGKSSFINAIIGDNILPVDTKVATSQAFRIINSEKQAFYLVFTDGSKQEVKREELDNYGSQAKIDKDGEPIIFGKIVDYMEVHTPIPFLPKSVVLVDTPGLGAIYANHAVVTKRHLAKASAVIFIMDPSNPLTDAEISFLNEITDITANVLLVMTKQDNYDIDYIDSQIKRNLQILTEKGFQKKFTNNVIKIFPMSSTMLYDVSNVDMQKDEKEIFYEISSFDNVKKELLKLLQLTISLSKSVAAYNAVNEYNNRVMMTVSEINKILESPDTGTKILSQKQQLKEHFQSVWGPHGSQQKSIVSGVNAVINSYSTKASAIFNPGTEIYNKLLAEIESLSDYREAKNYAEQFPTHMMTDYMQAWRGLNEDCSEKIITIMSRFQKEMKDDRNQKIFDNFSNVTALPSYELPKYGLLDHFNFTKNGWFTLFFATSVLNIGLATIVALPIAVLIGWFSGNRSRTDRMKVELRNYLNTNLSSLRNQVLTNPMDNKDSLSKSLFETTKEQHLKIAQDMLNQIYNNQLAVYEDETERLNKQIDDIKFKKEAILKQMKTIKGNWDSVYNKLKQLREKLDSLEKLILSDENKEDTKE